MNAEMERYLGTARRHERAREQAHALRREAIDRFWTQVATALGDAAGRSARRLRHRLLRHDARRAAGVSA